MKLFESLIISCFCFAVSANNKQWSSFKEKYRKSFRSKQEENERLEIFNKRMAEVDAFNKQFQNGLQTFQMAVNELSDISPDELTEYAGLDIDLENELEKFIPEYDDVTPRRLKKVKLPKSVSYIKNLPPARAQGKCGSCWAFSTVAAMEAQLSIKYKISVHGSEQNILDCSPKGSCKRGAVSIAMSYIINSTGVNSALAYPYEGAKGVCRYNPSRPIGRIVSFKRVKKGDENALKEAVATKGPVVATIHATIPPIAQYKSGIIYTKECDPFKVDHAILIVGYGKENGTDYWLLRNSWGRDWGENGYGKLARNKKNHCGVGKLAYTISVTRRPIRKKKSPKKKGPTKKRDNRPK